MDDTRFGLRVEVPLPYDEAVIRATTALREEGFGILATIDMKETLKSKLNVEFRKYTILGACNPPLAQRALQAELEMGLLLPCHVIVYETGPMTSAVAAIAPLAMIALVGENPELGAVAREADAKLRHALTSLERVVDGNALSWV